MSVFSFSHPPINLLKDFDKELQDFNYNVLKAINKNAQKAVEDKKTVAKLTKSDTPKKKKKKKKAVEDKKNTAKLTKSDFPKKKKKKKAVEDKKTIAKLTKIEISEQREKADFLFGFNPCYTSATANHLLRMINKNPMVFRDALWKRCVNICCFGGNQAVEIVALSKILSSAQECFWQTTRKPLHLNVMFVEENRAWEKTIHSLFQTMTETRSIFDASTMTISFGFIDADFSKTLNDSVRKVIGEADIVTMVKFFCPRQIEIPPIKMRTFVQDVAATMKHNAVLFYLDSGMHLQVDILNSSLESLNCMRSIYGPIKLEPFTLDLDSIKRCVQLFWSKKKTICLTSCVVSSCAWIKSLDAKDPIKTIKILPEIKRHLSSAERQKITLKAWASEYALQKFHLKVCRIIPNMVINEDKDNEDKDFCNSDISQDFPRVLFPTKTKLKRIYIR